MIIEKIKKILLQKTDYGKTRYLNYLYRYDLKQFYQNSLMCTQESSEKTATRIRLLAHAVEKGLSLPNPRQGFGKEKILEMIALDKQYAAFQSKEDAQIHDLVCATVCAYAKFQKQYKIDLSFIPAEYLEEKETDVCAGIQVCEAKPISFSEIAHGRHSARAFSDRAVSAEDVLKIVRLAQTAPSACNRQATRIYACLNPEKKAEIMRMHGGIRGFDVPAVIFAVTGDLNLYQNEFERNTVFVDGGIFVMNLLYSISACGMVSCPVIWGSEPDMDNKLKQLLDIRGSHKIVSLVLAGYPKDEKYVATKSQKRRTEDIVFITQ